MLHGTTPRETQAGHPAEKPAKGSQGVSRDPGAVHPVLETAVNNNEDVSARWSI